MALEILIARDFDHMSEVAGRLLVMDVKDTLAKKKRYVLGLATGNTPTGVYKHVAKAANAGEFDSSKVSSFNLDEYVGLPGENAQQRALHPESYSYFMVQELFALLRKKFAETSVPWGTLIDQARLLAEMESHASDFVLLGRDAGKAISIAAAARSEYLSWIRDEILAAYEHKIKKAGGIDLHVVGVGQKGHIGFHEAGIPFEGNRMLLVQLDANTVDNAVRDGHFATQEQSPRYAVSMGTTLIFEARTVMLLANGTRKSETLLRALLEEPDCTVPVSYGQRYAQQGGKLICVLDKAAAAGVLANADAIRRRGARIQDMSAEAASIRVEKLLFFRDPASSLMG
ncbi:MAG: 6-phosphogluconolactonase [Polyangiaceae bacterium]|nr:6-phosphogluconolactonase [Polyangiaceae bacterium]